jgi:hypothetical protein
MIAGSQEPVCMSCGFRASLLRCPPSSLHRNSPDVQARRAASHTAVKRSKTHCYRSGTVLGKAAISTNRKLRIPCHGDCPLVAPSLVSKGPHPLTHLEMFLHPLALNVSVSPQDQSRARHCFVSWRPRALQAANPLLLSLMMALG